ncbi:hypothetical protein A3E89_02605 [Candidatus Campbellbacteria bacterium RIFCSPHIGHO2_12_FULL_35_10]|uniref:Cell shape-determining protein MreC n=2 Tax=Candidatus Campbelliibacteriota TaxID=1752727 RepID=A0A1F5ELS6_9BACT|nr:MAG: hypothetical protein A3E89_02605 [Candidatus Campbellbacteria bacterium RIFCSPHIGHO2_12_FULL_35_10]
MMMNYRLGTRKKNNNFFWFLLVIIVALFFYAKLTTTFDGFFRIFFSPLWGSKNQVEETSSDVLGFFVSKKTLIASNEQLKKTASETEMMLVDRNLLLKENLELKEIMGRKISQDMLLASVLSKLNASIYDTFVIDAGSDLGLRVGDKVFAYGDILIGDLSEVSKSTSRVRLFSFPKQETFVIVGIHNIEAVAVGRGAGNFEIKLPQNTDVAIGDPVFVGGIDTKILGNISEIFSDPKDPFQLIIVKGPINLFELKWVQILKSE